MKFQIKGTRRQAGSVGEVSNYTEIVEANSSSEAYRTVNQNPDYELIRVADVYVQCPNCLRFHIHVSPEIYLWM